MAKLTRADLFWIGGAFALALAARLAWVLYAEADPTDGRFNDSVFYHLVAANLAEGGGYTNPYTFHATAAWAPGYVFVLTPLYWFFGAHYQVAELANALFGAATVVAVYLLARELFDRTSAGLAAVLLAVMPGQVWFTSILYSETLFGFVFISALLLLVTAARQPRTDWRWIVAFGVVAGAAAIVRGVGLWLLIVAPLYLLLSRRDWRDSVRWSAIAIATAVLVVLPWTIRNAITMDSFVVISTSAGVNFWQGHHAGASGGNEFPTELLERYGPLTRPGAEVAISNAGLREGRRFALTHPREELSLSVRKVRELYKDDLIGLYLNEDFGQRPFTLEGLASRLRPVTNAAYFLVLGLAGIAMARWALERGRGPVLPVLVVLVWTAGHIAVFGQPRYHFPLVPLFCILAGWALAAVPLGWPQMRTDTHRRIMARSLDST